MNSSQLAGDLAAFVRARKALFFVQSQEEGRVERSIVEALASSGYRVLFWDAVRGAVELDGSQPVLYRKRAEDGTLVVVEGQTITLDVKATRQPPQILDVIERERKRAIDAATKSREVAQPIEGVERIVWVLRDYEPYLKDPGIRRYLRNLAETLSLAPREGAHAIVVLTTSQDVPPDLADAAVVVKWSLPDRAELAAILTATIRGLPKDKQEAAAPNGTREAAIEAAVGLSANAAATIFKKSLVTRDAKIDPVLVATEKKRVVNSAKGVEWTDPDPRGLDAVGGNENLKGWLVSRKGAFSEKAREFGLAVPKGFIFVGPPGNGKSLVAKAVAAAWGVPLLRLDIGACKGSLVGQSEQQIRAAFSLAETIGRCVLLIDEIEKAFAGAMGANDGGVSSDALGTFLTWMQERKSPVFVVATANDVTKLPPEMLRKGRFDVVWCADLPTLHEREEILQVALKQAKRTLSDTDVRVVAGACVDFAGVEVFSLVEEALVTAFADGMREIRAEDLLVAARAVVPLSRTMGPQIRALREWGKLNARPASKLEVASSIVVHGGDGGGELDLEKN